VGRHRRRHGPQHGKQPARVRHDDCECGDMQRSSRPGIPRSSSPPHARSGRDGKTQAGSVSDQLRKGRPRPRCRGLPRQTEYAHGGRLVFTREKPEAASTMRLTGQAWRNRHAPYPGTGRNRCKADAFRNAFKERGRGQRPLTGDRSGSRACERASRPCDGHSPKILLISRSRERRNETRRPLISLGYARLKPNPVGQQRLHSTIFPFGPQE
jgi:hypothetical protein